jgi:multidrug resistance efflux pump
MKARFFCIPLLVIFLSACSALGQKEPQALPTIVLDSGSSIDPPAVSKAGVVASGVVVPGQDAHMAFVLGGVIKSVAVSQNDQVKAGQLLSTLDDSAAQREVTQAERTLLELTSPTMVAAAQQAVAFTQKTQDEAQKKVDSLFYKRASDTLVENTEGEIKLAQQRLARAQDHYRDFSKDADDDPDKAAALVAMTRAQMDLNTLISKYNWYTGKPSEIDAAIARADLAYANAALQEAQWYLTALQTGQIPPGASGTKLSQLIQAKTNIEVARENLENTRLVSPIDGVVVTVDVVTGEYATPGKTVFVIIDLLNLQVDTTDLSERDIQNVKLGQKVTVTIKPLGLDVSGYVKSIAPLADTLGGDVVYKTTIVLDSYPPGLRAGMSVEVNFAPKE